MATGVATYAAAIVLSVTLSQPLWLTIMLVGAVALTYELLGGIHADIMSDTIQMMVLMVGIFSIGSMGLYIVGGWNEVFETLDPSRLRAIDFTSFGFGKDRDYGFWPLFIGGFFLYVSYYGCDQSQVQRELSARSLDDCRKSLLLNGLFRFPVVLVYCLVGLIIGAFVIKSPQFFAKVPHGCIDYVVPAFVVNFMPPGLVGLVFVAVMAAAMSSLDSSINSLSAATLEDIYKKFSRRPLTPKKEMVLSRFFTLLWGLFCIGFAFHVGEISRTVIEAINKIGSAFYGPIAAVFFLGLFVKRASANGVMAGFLLGVGVNLYLWTSVPDLSWLWWNAIGFADTILTGFLLSYFFVSYHEMPPVKLLNKKNNWRIWYGVLCVYTLILLIFLTMFSKILA